MTVADRYALSRRPLIRQLALGFAAAVMIALSVLPLSCAQGDDQEPERPASSHQPVGVDAALAKSASSPRHAEVEARIRDYFATWSEQDFDGYGRCFHREGVIQMLDDAGRLTTFARTPFVDWQRQMQQRGGPKMTETPETIDIRFEEQVARVNVYWKLVAGARVEHGYDHFTLIKQDGRWQIVHLLFYATPEKK